MRKIFEGKREKKWRGRVFVGSEEVEQASWLGRSDERTECEPVLFHLNHLYGPDRSVDEGRKLKDRTSASVSVDPSDVGLVNRNWR